MAKSKKTENQQEIFLVKEIVKLEDSDIIKELKQRQDKLENECVQLAIAMKGVVETWEKRRKAFEKAIKLSFG